MILKKVNGLNLSKKKAPKPTKMINPIREPIRELTVELFFEIFFIF